MSVISITPDASTAVFLPGAGFADAYRLVVDEPALTAAAAAARVFARPPPWVGALLALRNRIVAPFGLKGARAAPSDTARHIGFFPVVSQSKDRVVLGFDDRHLDFRVIVDVAPAAGGRQSVTATTLVRRHNLAGAVYLAFIMPFHRLIVRAMLAQAGGKAG